MSTPDVVSQRKIRRLLVSAEPALRPPFIERAPGYVALLTKDTLDTVIACSPTWAKYYDRTTEQMRGMYLPNLIRDGNQWIRGQIHHDPLWTTGDVAFVEVTLRDSYKGKWFRTLMAPIHAANIVVIMGEILDQDAPHEDKMQLVTFDELPPAEQFRVLPFRH